MAVFLYRWGRLAFRRRWAAVVLWVVVLAGVGSGAVLAPAAPDDGFSMPGTESQKAFDLIEQRFPGGGAEGADARIVFIAPDGQKVTTAKYRSAITATVTEAGRGPQTARATDPFTSGGVSGDGSTAYATITYKAKADDLTDATKATLTQALKDGRNSGLAVEAGGTALGTTPAAGGAGEALGVAIAALVLLVTFGSLAAAGLPLITALFSVGVGTASIFALGSVLGIGASTSTLATMLGVAVGIDYAVFIVSRYREERARGHAPQEAAGLAAGTAGSAVVFAGLTVVIGLAGLFVVGIPALTKMGMAAAGAVIVAVLVALTLVPALLGFFPRAVLARPVRRGGKKTKDGAGGDRWARLVLRRPLTVLLLAVAALAVVALPVTRLHLGYAGDESKPVSTSERRAYDALADAFGPGFNGPLTIVVDARGTESPKVGVASITEMIKKTDGIVSVSAPAFDADGGTAIFSAVPAFAPDDEKTADLVRTIRAERHRIERTNGATFAVTGSTAVNIDSAQKVQGALIPYLGVVVGLAFLLLLIVFRSVLVPLKAALGFLLSVLAALGSVVAVFQWGWFAGLLGLETTGPIMTLMPIFMVGIVFGLAMDYEVFLVARIREAYVDSGEPATAVINGFRHSARVVVAAALIMIAVFSGFIGSGEPLIKMIGFGMAIAVLFDAFVVRMTIVPAALALLGERAWWMPRWLDKVLPSVDVEGQALHRVPAAPETVDPRAAALR
ncbi:MMPL family transporter [Actinocorallia longicatena]